MPISNYATPNTPPRHPARVGPAVRRGAAGFVIGMACVTPGLSGGVIAAATGLYEPALHAVTHLHKTFVKSLLYLAPLAIGAGAGVLLLGNVMEVLMALAPFTVLYAFLGLVAGSFPALVREANAGGFRPRYLAAAGAAFALVLCIGWLLAGVLPPGGIALTVPGALVSGAVIAAGAILPGISSSFLLIQMGVYEELLAALTGFDIPLLALLGLGFGAAALGLVFLADWLFRRLRGYAYYAVIGFLLGSVVTVFPGFQTGWRLALDLALFALCTAGCWLSMRKADPASRESSVASR